MLLNMPTTQTREDVLTAMRDEPMTVFCLTGSRFFGTSTSSSDYDFFTDAACAPFLVSLGFTREGSAYGLDPNIEAVYRHPTGVDVQIVPDAAHKQAAQRLLLAMGCTYPSLWDWRKAFDAVILLKGWT